MVLDKLDRLDKHAATTAARIIDFSTIRFNHFRNQIHNALGGVKLTAPFAFGRCELAQKIFVNATNDVFFGFFGFIRDGVDVVDRVDLGRQFIDLDIHAGEIVIGQRTLE